MSNTLFLSFKPIMALLFHAADLLFNLGIVILLCIESL